VCVAYELDGKRIDYFPTGDALDRAKPIYEYLPGFSGDISACRRFADLPKQAQDYIRYLESAVSCRISYVSVGAERDEYIKL
ncbi:MAG: adenylosuccinate synthetase, partial [Oscillospiraceae bacterium]|nr:adenylosuccinate synthetase [Oscillospiraceae bacterium]